MFGKKCKEDKKDCTEKDWTDEQNSNAKDAIRTIRGESTQIPKFNIFEDGLITKASWRIRIHQAVDLLFPPTCAACGSPADSHSRLCAACMDTVRFLRSPLCVRCGTLFAGINGDDHLCGECINNPPPYTVARSICLYAPPVSILLQNLKYRTDRTAVAALAPLTARFDLSFLAKVDLVVPVPLFPRRLRERGMNQSLLLARLFFPNNKKAICPESLIRLKDTVPQTGLGGKRRRKNLKGAFAVKQKEEIQAKRICLIDDVFTTGTTVKECAQTLMRAGAAEVFVVTMARVVPTDVAGRLGSEG